jgi:hypothetical protein
MEAKKDFLRRLSLILARYLMVVEEDWNEHDRALIKRVGQVGHHIHEFGTPAFALFITEELDEVWEQWMIANGHGREV